MSRWAWMREKQTWHVEDSEVDLVGNETDGLIHLITPRCNTEVPLHVPDDAAFFTTTRGFALPEPGLVCLDCARIVRTHET